MYGGGGGAGDVSAGVENRQPKGLACRRGVRAGDVVALWRDVTHRPTLSLCAMQFIGAAYISTQSLRPFLDGGGGADEAIAAIGSVAACGTIHTRGCTMNFECTSEQY